MMSENLNKVAVTVVGSVIAGLILYWYTKSPAPVISADINWITTANPHAHLKTKASLKAMMPTATEDSLRALSTTTDNYIYVQMAALTLKNTSELTSKQINVTLAADGVLFHFDNKRIPSLSTNVTLPMLAPGESIEILAITRPPPLFADEHNLRITHDGMKVHPNVIRAPDDLGWIVGYWNRYPFVFSMFAVAGALGFILFVGALVVSLSVGRYFARRAKITTKRDAEDLVHFVDYLKSNRPDLLSSKSPSSTKVVRSRRLRDG
jgi:hypothetical protein